MDDKVIIIEPKDCEEIDIDETQMDDLDFFGRPVLTIEQDLERVRQCIKTRKPIQYGTKVVIKKGM